MAIGPRGRGSFLRALGKYSYGLYVFHYLYAPAITRRVFAPLAARGATGVVGCLLMIAVASAASFAVAWLSYRYFERPFLRLKRFFDYAKPEPKSEQPAATAA